MRRLGSAYVGEIDAIARLLGRPGIWLLHGAYQFGCTALADESPAVPRLRRTLDRPFPGLARLVEIAHQRGPAGDFFNVTWPGSVGVLTVSAPGRFAASINQAPMRRRTRRTSLLWIDYTLNAFGAIARGGRPSPEHLLRQAFEQCATFDEARRLLETAPVARPVLFMLVGCAAGERLLIEREGDHGRSFADRIVAANAWRKTSDGWRPPACGDGASVANNRRRVAALAAWSGRDADRFGWATAPVLNACTRLTVEMCPAQGTLKVAGWESDGSGNAIPVTAPTEI